MANTDKGSTESDNDEKQDSPADDYVEVDESYIKKLAEEDTDCPRLRAFFVALGVGALVVLIWLIVSVHSLTEKTAPILESIAKTAAPMARGPVDPSERKLENLFFDQGEPFDRPGPGLPPRPNTGNDGWSRP